MRLLNPDGTFATTKAFVFLTDGLLNVPLPPGEIIPDNLTEASPLSVDMFNDACDQLRQDNVIRYTLAFTNNALDMVPVLRDCASDPKADHFFQPMSGDELEDAFRDIALQVRTLTITK